MVMSLWSLGSFSLASMALSSALPKIVLISSGSIKVLSWKERTALKSICFFCAILALSRIIMSKNSFPV